MCFQSPVHMLYTSVFFGVKGQTAACDWTLAQQPPEAFIFLFCSLSTENDIWGWFFQRSHSSLTMKVTWRRTCMSEGRRVWGQLDATDLHATLGCSFWQECKSQKPRWYYRNDCFWTVRQSSSISFWSAYFSKVTSQVFPYVYVFLNFFI